MQQQLVACSKDSARDATTIHNHTLIMLVDSCPGGYSGSCLEEKGVEWKDAVGSTTSTRVELGEAVSSLKIILRYYVQQNQFNRDDKIQLKL